MSVALCDGRITSSPGSMMVFSLQFCLLAHRWIPNGNKLCSESLIEINCPKSTTVIYNQPYLEQDTIMPQMK